MLDINMHMSVNSFHADKSIAEPCSTIPGLNCKIHNFFSLHA